MKSMLRHWVRVNPLREKFSGHWNLVFMGRGFSLYPGSLAVIFSSSGIRYPLGIPGTCIGFMLYRLTNDAQVNSGEVSAEHTFSVMILRKFSEEPAWNKSNGTLAEANDEEFHGIFSRSQRRSRPPCNFLIMEKSIIYGIPFFLLINRLSGLRARNLIFFRFNAVLL